MKKLLLGIFGIILLASIAPTYALGFGLSNTGNNSTPEVGEQINCILEETGSYYIGDTSKKELYLTFDNGYENGYTGKILDVLKKTETEAAFFVTGHFLTEEPELTTRMATEGHVVGNHSWSHPDMTKLDSSEIKQELSKVEQKYFEITNKEIDRFIRPPRGVFDKELILSTNEYNYTSVFWSLAFVDWHIDKQQGWEYSYDNIMDRVHNGSIMLLHTVSKDNADALEKAIVDLKSQGYEFKSLYDLTKPEI